MTGGRLLVVATLAACTTPSGSSAHAPSQPPVTEGSVSANTAIASTLDTLDLPRFSMHLEELSSDDLASLEAFANTVPNPLPSMAAAYHTSVPGVEVRDGLPVWSSPDGSDPVLAMANLGPPLVARFSCLVDLRPSPCSAAAPAPAANLGTEEGVLMPLEPADGWQRVDVLIEFAGDDQRPEPASWSETIVSTPAWETSADITPAPPSEPLLGGCGFATIVDSLKTARSFRPLALLKASDPAWLLIQPCPGETTTFRPVLLVDGSPLATEQPWHRPVQVHGSATTLPLPSNLLVGDSTVRAAVVDVDDPLGKAMFTHPVQISSRTNG